MEQTLGKRIAQSRKRLGMTQDQLAEKLGVTAQAVSKWENDQSCPDISMLPKLSGIFGISADELLGIQEERVHTPEVVPAPEAEKSGEHSGKYALEYTAGRKASVSLAVWVLLSGALALAGQLLHWDATLWDILWPSALLVFGGFYMIPQFSFLSLGSCLLGGFFLLSNLELLPPAVNKSLLLPVLLLLFGISLLADALRKPKKGRFHAVIDGKEVTPGSNHSEDKETGSFFCRASCCEERFEVRLPFIASGEADMRFGELTLDLTQGGRISNGCTLNLKCSFGEMKVLVPRYCRVQVNREGSFSAVEVSGSPDSDADTVVYANGQVNFGEIQFCYV